MDHNGGAGSALRRNAPRRDEAIAAIRTWIVDGQVRPGEPLVEAVLASQLGVSRVPVREALQTLAAEGFVEVTPGHTARVASPTVRDLLDVYEVRAALEDLSCRSAALRRDDDDLTTLDQLVEAGSAAAQAEDWTQVEQLNVRFHRTISVASGNRHLADLILGYRDKLFWLHRGSARRRGVDAWVQHRQIVDLIRAGNAVEAGKAGFQHTEVNRELFLADLAAGRSAFPWA